MSTSNHAPPTKDGFLESAEALGPYGVWPYLERRTTPDRRLGRTRLFSRYLLRGRRATGRRRGEGQNIYVDRYLPKDVALAVAILVLNILDAALTLIYIGDESSREANPFARYLIEMGRGWFIFSKAAVVALCILFLVVHKTFRLVRPAMFFLFTFYLGLLAYHVYLQFVGPQGGAS